MFKNLTKIFTVGMERDEWLDHRRRTIGGSEASAILGLNPWCSPYTVWADKLGKLPPKEDNEALRLGRDLEDYVAKRFTEATGKKVRRENAILYNEAYPFAHANVDRVVIGEDAGLECKTTSSLNLKKFKGGEYPANYYVQCMHYMMVTGAKRWYLAVLVLGREFMWFTIERDEEEIAALIEAEKDFYEKHILAGVAPMADGKQSTTEAIAAVYPDNTSEAVSLVGYEGELRQYIGLNSQIKALEALRDECANRIKTYLGDSIGGETESFKVSWATQTRRTFDTKRFASEHPEIDLERFYKTTTVRPFKITERG